jgi:hypothetical protein
MAVRAIQEGMDEAFRAAMQRSIDTGGENTPEDRHQESENRVHFLRPASGRLLKIP